MFSWGTHLFLGFDLSGVKEHSTVENITSPSCTSHPYWHDSILNEREACRREAESMPWARWNLVIAGECLGGEAPKEHLEPSPRLQSCAESWRNRPKFACSFSVSFCNLCHTLGKVSRISRGTYPALCRKTHNLRLYIGFLARKHRKKHRLGCSDSKSRS